MKPTKRMTPVNIFLTLLALLLALITVILFVLMLLVYLRMTTGPGGRYGIRNVRRRRLNYVKRKY